MPDVAVADPSLVLAVAAAVALAIVLRRTVNQRDSRLLEARMRARNDFVRRTFLDLQQLRPPDIDLGETQHLDLREQVDLTRSRPDAPEPTAPGDPNTIDLESSDLEGTTKPVPAAEASDTEAD